jgi:dinuclear metal center YbgI/SA1388 family protein
MQNVPVSSTASEPSSSSWTVGDCVRVLERAYEPGWAEDWDAVGLVCGSLDDPVSRVHLAIDPTLEVAQEAVASGAQLLVTHHPLFLRGVHGVAETSPGGRVVATLIRGGCALYTAHTNADVARPGVSDALAAVLGLRDLAPIAPLRPEQQPPPLLDKLVTFVPVAARARVIDALADAGAGGIGNYERCGWWATGTGTFRPLAGARPAIGQVGGIEEVAEDRVEMVLPRRARAAVVAALRAAHPYEEPAFDVFELASLPVTNAEARGLGRIGDLPAAQLLGAFVELVAAALPRTAWGVRATGDADRRVQRIAVCGGSGGELAGPAAALGADVLLTADARHHHTLDSLAVRDLVIVDAAHWATEYPWLDQVKRLLHTRLPAERSPETRVDPLAATVSGLVTDPWRLHSC